MDKIFHSNRSLFTTSNNMDLKLEAEDGSLAPNVFLKSRNATVGSEWDKGFDIAPAHRNMYKLSLCSTSSL